MSVPVVRRGGLWIARVPTRYGDVEAFCGEGGSPDTRSLLLVEQFLAGEIDHIAQVRRSAFGIPWLWRPIRLAINNQGRLGLQFMNRLSGRQEGMFFADEHSAFHARLADVVVQEGDAERLVKRDGAEHDA